MQLFKSFIILVFIFSCSEKSNTSDKNIKVSEAQEPDKKNLSIEQRFDEIDQLILRNDVNSLLDKQLDAFNQSVHESNTFYIKRSIEYIFENSSKYKHFDEDLWIGNIKKELDKLPAVQKSIIYSFYAEFIVLRYGLNSKHHQIVEELYLKSISAFKKTSVVSLSLFPMIIERKDKGPELSLYDFLAFRFYNYLRSNYEYHYVKDFRTLIMNQENKNLRNKGHFVDSNLVMMSQSFWKQLDFYKDLKDDGSIIRITAKVIETFQDIFPKINQKNIITFLKKKIKIYYRHPNSIDLELLLINSYIRESKFKLARKIAKNSLRRFKNNPKKLEIESILQSLEKPEASIKEVTNEKIKINVKNLNEVYLHQIKLSEKQYFKIMNGYFEDWETLNSKPRKILIKANNKEVSKGYFNKFREFGQYLLILTQDKLINKESILHSQLYQSSFVKLINIDGYIHFYDYKEQVFAKKKKILGIYFDQFENAKYEIRNEFTTNKYGAIEQLSKELNVDYLMLIIDKYRFYYRLDDLLDHAKKKFINRQYFSAADSLYFLSSLKNDEVTISKINEPIRVKKNNYYINLTNKFINSQNNSVINTSGFNVYYSNEAKFKLIKSFDKNHLYVNDNILNSLNIKSFLWVARLKGFKNIILEQGSYTLGASISLDFNEMKKNKEVVLDFYNNGKAILKNVLLKIIREDKGGIELENNIFDRNRKIKVKINDHSANQVIQLYRLTNVNSFNKYKSVQNDPFKNILKLVKKIKVDNQSSHQINLRKYRESYYLIAYYRNNELINYDVFLLLNLRQKKHRQYHPGGYFKSVKRNNYWYGAEKKEVIFKQENLTNLYSFKRKFRIRKLPFNLRRGLYKYISHNKLDGFTVHNQKEFKLNKIFSDTLLYGEKNYLELNKNEIIIASNNVNPLKRYKNKTKPIRIKSLNYNLDLPQFTTKKRVVFLDYQEKPFIDFNIDFYKLGSSEINISDDKYEQLYFNYYTVLNESFIFNEYKQIDLIKPFKVNNIRYSNSNDSIFISLKASFAEEKLNNIILRIYNFDDLLFTKEYDYEQSEINETLSFKKPDSSSDISSEINPVLQLNYGTYRKEYIVNQ